MADSYNYLLLPLSLMFWNHDDFLFGSYNSFSPQSLVIYKSQLAVSVFSSTGRRPASLCHGPLSVVRPSVRPLTLSLNIFFSETAYRILMKFHRNVPTMVLFRFLEII